MRPPNNAIALKARPRVHFCRGFVSSSSRWGVRQFKLYNEKFIAPPSSQTVKEVDLGRVLSINHQFLKIQI